MLMGVFARNEVALVALGLLERQSQLLQSKDVSGQGINSMFEPKWVTNDSVRSGGLIVRLSPLSG